MPANANVTVIRGTETQVCKISHTLTYLVSFEKFSSYICLKFLSLRIVYKNHNFLRDFETLLGSLNKNQGVWSLEDYLNLLGDMFQPVIHQSNLNLPYIDHIY